MLRIGCVKYLNALPLIRGWPGEVDFDHPSALCQRVAIGELDVALVSSSFADELIGKLFAEFGPIEFMGRFKLVGVSATVQQLIDRAISQRLANGPSK